MNAFTIKDLENLSGIKAHTIRIWEQRYHFLKPRRTSTNIRYYSNDELKTVLNIALLNKYGFKISEIDGLQPGEIREKIFLLDDTAAIQERLINELLQEMIDMNMERFEKIIADFISEKGMERTVLQIILPFLERIGILWQTGYINPAQEHLVTNIIRQKLLVAIETTDAHIKLDKTFLLFLPEGEQHELGLLFMYYLVKARGAKTIYLGANVPIKDVEQVIKLKQPDIVFVHLSGSFSGLNFEKFLREVQLRFHGLPTILSGLKFRKKLPPGVQYKRSLVEVMEYLSFL